jgi:uncharacterized protein YegP (UPF0339 family)
VNAKATPEDDQLKPGWGLYEDEANEWRWRYVSPHNGNILAVSSEGYHNEGDAADAMDAVKMAGAVAVSLEHPVEPTVLEATVGGPELPDPLPSPLQAANEVNAALKSMNVAEQNLSHGRDDNMLRYALTYVLAERRLNLAISVVEVVGKDGEGIDGVDPVELAQG